VSQPNKKHRHIFKHFFLLWLDKTASPNLCLIGIHGTALQYIWTLMTNTKTADTCHTLAYEKCNGTYIG